MIFPSLVLGALAFLLPSSPVHSFAICQRRIFYLDEAVDMFGNYTDLVSVTMDCSKPSFPEVTITAEHRLQEDTESRRSRNPKVEFSVTCSGVTESFNRSAMVRKTDPWTVQITSSSDIVVPMGGQCSIIGCFYDDYNNIQRRAAIKRSTCTIHTNECDSGTASCEHECIDTVAGYNCSCRPGYQLEVNLHNCTDIDECSTGEHACSYQCANTDGSYSCLCPTGFQLLEDNHTCLDVDECAGEHGCEYGCNNINGSFECFCETGFELDSTGYACQDIDECAGEHGCEYGCNNINGSFECFCETGFELDSTGYACQDIDECAGEHSCAYGCKNTDSGYDCLCENGSEIASAGHVCQDVTVENELSSSQSTHAHWIIVWTLLLIVMSLYMTVYS